MKKALLTTCCILLTLASCKDKTPEGALAGTHTITITYSGNNSTGSFNQTIEGSADIEKLPEGIVITISSTSLNTSDIMSRVTAPGADTVRYQQVSEDHPAGTQPSYLQYIPNAGKFYFRKVSVTGHSQASSYDVTGDI